jgi:hypothetical protein
MVRTSTRQFLIVIGLALDLACSVRIGAAAAPEVPLPSGRALEAELQSGARDPLRRSLNPVRHREGISEEEALARAARARNRPRLLEEKTREEWFAALVDLRGPEALTIRERFATLEGLADFIRTNQALVEMWVRPVDGDPGKARRLSRAELARPGEPEAKPPTILTLTYRDAKTGQVQSNQVEFAYNAPERALASLSGSTPAMVPSSDRELLEPILGVLHLENTSVNLPPCTPSHDWDKARQEGGVIEEQLPAPGSAANLPISDRETELHLGPTALKERYTEVLSDLLEWRHYLRKKSMGLPMDTQELLRGADVLDDLARKGIWIDDHDALVALDPTQSTFTYRRYIQKQPRLVQVTGLLPKASLVREVEQAELEHRQNNQKRSALAPGGQGWVEIHRVVQNHGQVELGPLALTELSGEGIDSLLGLIERLPVTNRASLDFGLGTTSLIDADLDGSGRRDRFFFTLEYPPGKIIERERTNPITGELEHLFLKDGLLIQTVTDARITEIDYDADRIEAATRVYANTGSRQVPRKGTLLEETWTVETWERDETQPSLDPFAPRLAKSKLNHVTGENTREIYGIFPLPIATVDDQFITYRQFNRYGLFVSGLVFDNGRVEQDFQRPLAEKLRDPVVGRERFQLTSTIPSDQLDTLRTLKGQGYVTRIERRNLAKRSSATQVFDNAHAGRKVSESYADRLEGASQVSINIAFEYRDDFFSGEIPVLITERSAASGRLLSSTSTKQYDPLLRRTTGVQVDYTGKVLTNIWNSWCSVPVESQMGGRKVVCQYNREETQLSGTITSVGSGEELSRFNGRFDSRSQHWLVDQVNWYRPGLTNEITALTRSGAGRLLSARIGDAFERRVDYDRDGCEEAANLYRRHPAASQFNLLQEHEDDFRWSAGERDARVQTYVDGQPYDAFRRVQDLVERTRFDQVKEMAGLTLRTAISYDGWSARPLRAVLEQGKDIRLSSQWGAEDRQPDGSTAVSVSLDPHWGLRVTQSFRIGDPWHRPFAIQFENGDRLVVRQWFDGTSIPKSFDLLDRQGHAKERIARHLNAGTEGNLPFDLLEREALGHWGERAPLDTRAVVRGTDVLLFRGTPWEKVLYDPSQPFDNPVYAVDPDSQSGSSVLIRGKRIDHVTRMFRARLALRPEAGQKTGERCLRVDAIDLRQGTNRTAARREFDRASQLLDEHLGTVPPPNAETDDALVAALAKFKAVEHYHYRYQPGWLVEMPATGERGRSLVFSTKQPKAGEPAFAVNEGGVREFVTAIEAIKSAPLNPAERTALKNYFFRQIEQPRLIERNPYLPGCSGVWTAWNATDLAPAGAKLSESELILTALGTLSVRRTTAPTHQTPSRVTMAFQLPEPDLRLWKTHPLTAGINSISLDLGGLKSLAGCDFVYFFLDATNAVSWKAIFQSATARQIEVVPNTVRPGPGQISAWRLVNLGDAPWESLVAGDPGVRVGAPQSQVARTGLMVIGMNDLARAGLDAAKISSAVLQIQGSTTAQARLSPLSRIVREQ